MGLVVAGAVTVEEARGFYSRLVRRLGSRRVTPGRFLASVIFVGGGLSAVFNNDVTAQVRTLIPSIS